MKYLIGPLSLLLILGGCGSSMPEHAVWSGTVQLAEGMVLPFLMDLDFTGAEPSGYFLVGDEKTPIPEISKTADSLTLTFSEYGAEMRGAWKDGRLEGEYLRHRAGGTRALQFSAAPAQNQIVDPGIEIFPTGNYQVHFQDEASSTTVAKLWRNGNAVYGTFIAPDGDYGLLTGQQVDDRIQLNRFTGWQAMAIELKQGEGPSWSGNVFTASGEPQAFTLQPQGNLEVPTPPHLTTSMKDPEAPFIFSGVSLSGESVRSTDDRFRGKALIVDIMGTWCHNCLDEAPVLQQLQEQFGKDGLEIVGLSFEISDDPSLAKKNLKLYRDRFGLSFPLLFCGSLDQTNVERQLHSQLNNFFAYPTTLFIDRKGNVRFIHSGFRGPGAGGEFQAQVREFNDLAKQLLSTGGN